MNVIAVNTIKKNKFMILNCKKTVVVEGHGSYEIEITNVVNSSTMEVQPVVPSLMSSTNL